MRNKMIPTPKHAITGRPEIPAMAVNSVDELGRCDLVLFRSQAGQLYAMAADAVPKRVTEREFTNWLKKQYEKK